MGTVLVAAAVGILILVATWWTVRFIASGPPPEPDPNAIEEVEAHYRCTVCGMNLVVTYAQGDDDQAPRHCREEMVLV